MQDIDSKKSIHKKGFQEFNKKIKLPKRALERSNTLNRTDKSRAENIQAVRDY